MKLKNALSVLALVCSLVFTSCNKLDEPTLAIPQEIAYTLVAVADSGVSGTATFTKEENGSSHVLIELNNSNTTTNPAFINFNSASEGGDVAITLTACECSVSNTTITQFDNGETIAYEGLVTLNGHITILDETGHSVAVADIGSNSN
mgnify:CR=1 FL=1